MKDSNKGFTLVEVLAVIVILGILSTIGVVTVINIRKNQEKKFDQNQLSLFKQTAKTYFSDHKTSLPIETESTYRIYLNDLIEENYIDSLLKYDKKSYDKDKSYVLITRMGEEFIYKVMLCKEINDQNVCDDVVEQDNTNKSNITFKNFKKDNSNTTITPINSIYYSNKTTTVDYVIEDVDGIKAAKYYIYKNGKQIYEATPYNPKSNPVTDTITLNMNNYEDGEYKIKIEVYDENDNKTVKTSSIIHLDRVKPTCSVSGGSSTWINKTSTTQSRIITATCKDTGSGCVTNKISKEYTNNINTLKAGAGGDGIGGTVSDRAGNTTSCLANQIVKIDKIAPAVKVSASSQNTNYNTTTADVTTSVNEKNSAKYELSISGYSSKKFADMKKKANNGNNKSSIVVNNSYDGTKKTIYVTVVDIAGNRTKASTTYSIYKSCSKQTTSGTVTYGSCSANCGTGGTRTQTQPMKDTYLDVACDSVVTTVACESLPDCCSNVRYVNGSSCSAACGGGTLNRVAYSNYNNQRCPANDQSTGGSSCNTQACCSNVRYENGSSCSAACGGGTYNQLAYSIYNGQRCTANDLSSGGSACNTQGCCSSVRYENGSSCSAKCGGGTYNQLAYSIYNGQRCTANDLSSGGSACNTQGCCSSVTYKDGTKCTKTCGGGTYNKLAYSAYTGARCKDQDKNSGGSACNKQACCSKDSYSGCDVIYPCRDGNTSFYSKTNGEGYQKSVAFGTKLYKIKAEGDSYYVYASTFSTTNSWFESNYGYVRKKCTKTTKTKCEASVCPG